jgi:hypothetical protein
MYSVIGSLVGSVDGVMLTLVIEDATCDLVEEEDDLVFGGLGLEVGLDGAEDKVAERVLVNLGEDLMSIHKLLVVVEVGVGQGHNQSDQGDFVHVCRFFNKFNASPAFLAYSFCPLDSDGVVHLSQHGLSVYKPSKTPSNLQKTELQTTKTHPN